MKDNQLMLQQGQWYALRVLPDVQIGWSSMESSPALVTDVNPLKSGKGIIRLAIVPLLYPAGPKEIVASYKVIHHRTSYMVAITSNFAGEERTCIFEEIDFDWLNKHSPIAVAQFKSGLSAPGGAQESLTTHLRKLISAASPANYPGKNRLSPMPEQKAYLTLNKEFSEYDSFLISKGHIPEQMEDKWLIYRKDDHLYFHRSWIGYCIYEVALGHREGRLYLSHGYVNRDSREYSEINDAHDVALLYYLIDVLLLEKQSDFPISAETDAPAVIA